MDSIRVRALFYLGICLSVFSVVCQGQMSDDNRLSSQEEQFPLGYVTRDLADALERLLEGVQQDNRIGLSVEKKASLIPRVSKLSQEPSFFHIYLISLISKTQQVVPEPFVWRASIAHGAVRSCLLH
uniref:Cocaine- and amphetamine-regulated transcript protein-like n=1 Tax=Salmo trutta TaxID=8032 RepID=A0A674CP19_SALTR